MAEKKDTRKTAIVIGAGAGGIATAARLAKAGLAVTVLEKNDHTGGRCSILRHGPYRFDQGPSLLLLPRFFREAFHDLDTSLEAEGVDLLRCQPSNYDVWFADGERFRQSSDLALTKAQVERLEGPGGFERYLAWMAEAHAHYELSAAHVLRRNFASWRDLLTDWAFLKAAPRLALGLHPAESIWRRAGRYFRSERLRRVFTFATMYMGMSPFEAPATYSLLQYTEQAEGVWYPRGGFHGVLEALVRVGERLGVRYRLGCAARRILAGGGPDGLAATGVELEGGEVLRADVVVVNADLVYAYSNLFPESSATRRYSRALRARKASCSSLSFYWSLSRKVPELSTHNIFLADDYRGSFDSIFKDQSLPAEPSFYVNVPSRVDPSAAPASADAVIALVPVGHLQKSQGYEHEAAHLGLPPAGRGGDSAHWDALVDRAREAVLATISARTGCGALGGLIEHEVVNTPLTWQDKFNLDKGAILGLSHDFLNVLAFRPRTRARGLRGAYFVGASTHPGTGVPIVLAGAKLTAEQVLRDLGLGIPWARGRAACGQDRAVRGEGGEEEEVKELDKLQGLSWTVGDVAMAAGGALALLVVVLYLLWPGGRNVGDIVKIQTSVDVLAKRAEQQ